MFENLEVYQKAIAFADKVACLTERFPRGYGFLVDQLNRAALSIATNIAEGNGRFTKADRKHFFTIARGSVQECVPLLELGRRRRLVDEGLHKTLRQDLESMAKMISGLIRGLGKRKARFCSGRFPHNPAHGEQMVEQASNRAGEQVKRQQSRDCRRAGP